MKGIPGIPRSRRFVVVLCVAVLVGVLIAPSAAHHVVDFAPLWIVAPALFTVLFCRHAIFGSEQSLSLLSLGDARAPPARLF